MTITANTTTSPAPVVRLSCDELRVLADVVDGVCPPACAGDGDESERRVADLVARRGLAARGMLGGAIAAGSTAVLEPGPAIVSEELGLLIDAMQGADTIVEVEQRTGTSVERIAVLADATRPELALVLTESDVDVWTWAEPAGGTGPDALAEIVRSFVDRPRDTRHPGSATVVLPTVVDGDADEQVAALLERPEPTAAADARRTLRRTGLTASEADAWCTVRAGAHDTFVTVGHRSADGRTSAGEVRWLTAADGRIVLLEPEPESGTPLEVDADAIGAGGDRSAWQPIGPLVVVPTDDDGLTTALVDLLGGSLASLAGAV